MRSTEIDHRIEALADGQFGAFGRRQAFELGATDRFVHRRLAQGVWLRPVPGVYVLARSRGTWRRQCKIAELSVDGSAVGGRSAAAWHDLTGFRPGRVELVVPANAYCTHPFALLHRYSGVKVTTVAGIRVTTIAQTLFDIAARVYPWTLERAMDDALATKRLHVGELDERLSFYAGSRRPGLPRIKPLVLERREDGFVPPESELEARLLALLGRLPSVPRVVRQASFRWREAQASRVDVLLPDHRLIIEADGRRWHTRLKDFDNDRWRDNEAIANGYRVMRFTWVHVHDLADDVINVIERAIARNWRVPA